MSVCMEGAMRPGGYILLPVTNTAGRGLTLMSLNLCVCVCTANIMQVGVCSHVSVKGVRDLKAQLWPRNQNHGVQGDFH